MKNIYEILKDYGLEIPEEKKADFDKSWKENYRTKNEYDKAVNQRDEYKTSLDTVNESSRSLTAWMSQTSKGRSQNSRTI